MGTKHGHNKRGKESATHISWRAMLQRCFNPAHEMYPIYGGRGIKVAKDWLKFENFLADMGKRPKGKTLDRINVNGNYSPGNVRWATKKQQSLNKRSAA
jgi:hypothetical protein